MKVIKNCGYLLKIIYVSDKRRLLFMVFLSLISTLKNLISVWFIKLALDFIIVYQSFKYLLILVLIERIISLILSYFECLLLWEKCPVSDNINKQYIHKMLYSKSLKVGLSELDNPDFYDKFNRAINEAENRPSEILSTIESFFSSILTIFSVSSIVILLDWRLIILAVLSSLISVLTSIIISKMDFKKNNDLTRLERKISYVRRLFYLPQYIEELKTNNYNNLLFTKLENSTKDYKIQLKKYQPKIVFIDIIRNWQTFVLNFGIAALFIGKKIIKRGLEAASFTSLIYASTTLSSSLSNLFSVIPQMVKHSLFINNLREILDYHTTTEPKGRVITVQKAQNHSIKLEHISFKYETAADKVLKDICLEINKGEKIAFVGENGAGKSTLIKLILRLYDPQSGELYFDGNKYKNLEKNSLRSEIAVVYQNFQSFAFSIGENVLTKELEGSKDENNVWEALKASGLYTRVKKLPENIHTPLTNEFDDYGINLSGGEQQKLAIAKAVCKDAGVVIMDEPSSSLDPKSEHDMYALLFDMCANKTLILISHRLYSVKMVDKIYYLENGYITECGDHEELINLNGKYANLYNIQAEQYRK